MNDPYLYEGTSVLRNKLGIKESTALDVAEAEISRANMMELLESGFQDFSPRGMRAIHRKLFQDVYDWAGKYRTINIEKRERVLAGLTVWYSRDEAIPKDLETAFKRLNGKDWADCPKDQFVKQLTEVFPPIWQVHPFREGNTRTTVLLMTLFTEHHGFDMNFELLAKHSGYVRDSFVMASIGEYAEPEHLAKILSDAVQTRNDGAASPPKPGRTPSRLSLPRNDNSKSSTDYEYE